MESLIQPWLFFCSRKRLDNCSTSVPAVCQVDIIFCRRLNVCSSYSQHFSLLWNVKWQNGYFYKTENHLIFDCRWLNFFIMAAAIGTNPATTSQWFALLDANNPLSTGACCHSCIVQLIYPGFLTTRPVRTDWWSRGEPLLWWTLPPSSSVWLYLPRCFPYHAQVLWENWCLYNKSCYHGNQDGMCLCERSSCLFRSDAKVCAVDFSAH